jgi:hypothetical protein
MKLSDSVAGVVSSVSEIFHRTRGESVPETFLKISVLSANLSSKLTDIRLVLAISGHYPQSVQTDLMSADEKTVPDALSLPKSF